LKNVKLILHNINSGKGSGEFKVTVSVRLNGLSKVSASVRFCLFTLDITIKESNIRNLEDSVA
jgi:hypothetical protein